MFECDCTASRRWCPGVASVGSAAEGVSYVTSSRCCQETFTPTWPLRLAIQPRFFSPHIFNSRHCLSASKMSLSEKSDGELRELLTKYGIEHGPIVSSTRRLYEKKLENAMEKVPEQPSSDKTYYREEEEEITYITYHSQVKHDGTGDMLKHRVVLESSEKRDDSDKELDNDTEILSQTRTVSHSAARSRSREPTKKAGGGAWKVFRLLLVLAVLAGVSYYVYCLM